MLIRISHENNDVEFTQKTSRTVLTLIKEHNKSEIKH